MILRTLQAIGGCAEMVIARAIVRDLFDGAEARAKMSYVVFAVNIVPMMAGDGACGGKSIGLVVLVMVGVALAFGLIRRYISHDPHP